MRIKLVTSQKGDHAPGLSRYWGGLQVALSTLGIEANWVSLREWRSGEGGADPLHDIIVVLAHESGFIQEEYATIILRHGCATERGLRCSNDRSIELGATEVASARRKRAFRVAADDWSAHYGYVHSGARTDRIIYGALDIDQYLPAERQRLRNAKRPTILHDCTEHDKGSDIIGDIGRELAGEFDMLALPGKAPTTPEDMRKGDVWLGLAASGGLWIAAQEAMATNLVVVGADVGLLWSLREGRSVPCTAQYANLWLNDKAGVAVFDWQWRESVLALATFVRKAWAERKALQPREYARQWFGYPLFAAKWLDAIQAAATRFGIKA